MRLHFFSLTILFALELCSEALFAAPPPQEVSGTLTVTIADYFAENRSETRYFINDQTQPGRTYEVQFATQTTDTLTTGMIVRVRGTFNGALLKSAELIATQSAKGIVPQPTSSTSTGPGLPSITPVTGVQKTLLYILQSATSQNNFTNSQLHNIMFAQSGLSVTTMYQENSFGAVSFEGDVIGPYTINDYTINAPVTCDTVRIASQADNAATAAGIDILRLIWYGQSRRSST
jgi:hypothetical protein